MNDIISILYNRQFNTFLEAIEYLYIAGYSLKDAHTLASNIHAPYFDIDISNPNLSAIEALVFEQLNGCEIKVKTRAGLYSEENIIYVSSDGRTIFLQQNLNEQVLFITNDFYHKLPSNYRDILLQIPLFRDYIIKRVGVLILPSNGGTNSDFVPMLNLGLLRAFHA